MSDALFLRTDEVTDLAAPEEYVEAVREAYRQIGEGAPAEPRTALANHEPAGMLTTYIAVLPDTGAMGGYTYSAGFGANDAWFLTPIFDAESGAPLALLDGAYMNPFKTGAAGALGIDLLAREDASILGLIGSGKQARGQLRAATTVRSFDEIRVYSPTPANRESFASEFDGRLGARVSAVESSSRAVRSADVVITATTASDPVFDGEELAPGTHVTAMGQYHPEKRELDETTIARATYVPDLRDRALQDAGSFLHALEAGVVNEDHIHAELGEVAAGVAAGRTSPDEITVFDSGGTAIETVAAGYMLYTKATAEGRGTRIEFTPASKAMPDGSD